MVIAPASRVADFNVPGFNSLAEEINFLFIDFACHHIFTHIAFFSSVCAVFSFNLEAVLMELYQSFWSCCMHSCHYVAKILHTCTRVSVRCSEIIKDSMASH